MAESRKDSKHRARAARTLLHYFALAIPSLRDPANRWTDAEDARLELCEVVDAIVDAAIEEIQQRVLANSAAAKQPGDE